MSSHRIVAVPCIRLNCYCFRLARAIATRPNSLSCRDARKHETTFDHKIETNRRGLVIMNLLLISNRLRKLTRLLSSMRHPMMRAQWALWPFFKHGA